MHRAVGLAGAVAVFASTAVLSGLPQQGVATGVASAPAPDGQTALLQQYCIGCHNDRLKSGGMTLTELDLQHVERSPELAEKIVRKLQAGLMPPAGAKRPDPGAARAFATTLAAAIDTAALSHPNPGWRSFQRLSRVEYARSIHDLLGIDVDVAALLPPDSLSDGFDNIAEAQTFSPAVLDGYIRAARKVVVDALGDPAATASSATYTISSTTNQMRHVEGAPMGTRGGVSVVHNFPADGEYVFNVKLQAATNGGLIGRRSPDEKIEISINGARAALLDIAPNMSESTSGGLGLRTGRIAVEAGPQRVSAAFIQKYSGLVDDLVAPIEYTLADAIGAPQLLQVPHLQDLNITGPFAVSGVSDTPSRRRVFACRPSSADDEHACAESIVGKLAAQAYRRPVGRDEIAELMSFYDTGRENGDFESGIRTALQAVLSSPRFVFRFEEQPNGVQPGQRYRIGDVELASRLSYFLWSGGPDAELIAVAARGRLHEPAQLERQVRRLLADPRAESLATRFASAWLRLAELDNLVPDALLYPNYDRTLAQAMRRETELFFDSMRRQDRDVLDLLTADDTFVNERLALHYGIPGILGSRFRHVTLKDDSRRGLLGKGGILALTSNADRTSPVLRGKWIMEVLLGTPPPPPPPNVPSLDSTRPVKDGRVLTVRQRMEAHRANPACSSCHRMIDPIGLSLENFDVTGAWRVTDAGMPIDSSSVLYDGTPLDGPASLRQAILKYSDAFIGNFTENLLMYALGRRIQYSDMPAIRGIARDASLHGNRFSAFVLGIVNSAPFQMSRAESPAAAH